MRLLLLVVLLSMPLISYGNEVDKMKLAFSVVSEEIKKEEGIRLKVYKCPAGKWSIGYGRNLEDVGITQEEADFLLQNDLKRCDLQLNNTFPFYSELDAVRQFVLIDMCYNLGLDGLKKFKKMISALEAKDYETASKEMLDSLWAKQVKSRADKLAKIMETGELPK